MNPFFYFKFDSFPANVCTAHQDQHFSPNLILHCLKFAFKSVLDEENGFLNLKKDLMLILLVKLRKA